jgi:hypothetical protein
MSRKAGTHPVQDLSLVKQPTNEVGSELMVPEAMLE